MSLLDKIDEATEKFKRKTKAEKAKSRASARRIERGEPKTLGEKAAVGKEKAGELETAVSEFVETKTPETSGESTEKASGLLSGFGSGGEAVVEDLESGELDMFGTSRASNDEMDGDGMGYDEFGQTDLDMDLDDF